MKKMKQKLKKDSKIKDDLILVNANASICNKTNKYLQVK